MSLDEMQARCDAATPGPWKLEPVGDHKRIIFGPNGNSWGTDVGEINSDDADYDEAMRTAEFVSHARTDMPRLIAALRVAMRMIANQSKQLTGEALLEWCEREGHDGPPDFEGAYEALVEQANHALARVAAILEAK